MDGQDQHLIKCTNQDGENQAAEKNLYVVVWPDGMGDSPSNMGSFHGTVP